MLLYVFVILFSSMMAAFPDFRTPRSLFCHASLALSVVICNTPSTPSPHRFFAVFFFGLALLLLVVVVVVVAVLVLLMVVCFNYDGTASRYRTVFCDLVIGGVVVASNIRKRCCCDCDIMSVHSL